MNNNIELLLSELDLLDRAQESGTDTLIEITSSDEFSRIFSSISLDNNFNVDGDSIASEDETMFVFTDGEIEVRLTADYNEDKYLMIVSEK